MQRQYCAEAAATLVSNRCIHGVSVIRTCLLRHGWATQATHQATGMCTPAFDVYIYVFMIYIYIYVYIYIIISHIYT